MDPRAEARERTGGRYDVRVLEPAPPAVADGSWFADDPLALSPRDGTRPLLTPVPVPGADLTWDELAGREPELAPWCADRWLGAWRRLAPVPELDRFTSARRTLHEVAEHVLSPARAAANGKIGLRFTRGGFGTPYFGDDDQVRVEGTELVRVHRGEETGREPIAVEPAAAFALAEWYGFACSVAEELRAGASGAAPSRVQLWPEHFDLSVDLGDEAAGTRGTFGASPGDDAHPEPYLYVTHWTPRDGEFWNDTAFGGASLGYAALLAAPDQRAAALDFFRAGQRALGQD